MEDKEAINGYKAFIKQNLLILALGLIGMILFGYGLITLFLASNSSQNDIVFEASDENKESLESNIAIDIQGSVANPGVYKLPSNSIVQDAIVASGGLTNKADQDFISKNINLASKLSDGGKIYIPAIGENTKSVIGETSNTGSVAGGKININTASTEVLDSLPGIGPATIQKIINGRPYTSISELLEKKIVGSKVFEEIKEKISVY